MTIQRVIRCLALAASVSLVAASSTMAPLDQTIQGLGFGLARNYAAYDSVLQYVISPPSIAASILVAQSFSSNAISDGIGTGLSPLSETFGKKARTQYDDLVTQMKGEGWSISCQVVLSQPLKVSTPCDNEMAPTINSATIDHWAKLRGYDRTAALTPSEQGPTKHSAVSILMMLGTQLDQSVEPTVQAGFEPVTYLLGKQPRRRATGTFDLYQGGLVEGVRLVAKGGETLYLFSATSQTQMQSFASGLASNWGGIRTQFKKTQALIQFPVSLNTLSYISLPGQSIVLPMFGDKAASDFVQRASVKIAGNHLEVRILQTLVGDAQSCCRDEGDAPPSASGVVSSTSNVLVLLESQSGRIDLVAGAKE